MAEMLRFLEIMIESLMLAVDLEKAVDIVLLLERPETMMLIMLGVELMIMHIAVDLEKDLEMVTETIIISTILGIIEIGALLEILVLEIEVYLDLGTTLEIEIILEIDLAPRIEILIDLETVEIEIKIIMVIEGLSLMIDTERLLETIDIRTLLTEGQFQGTGVPIMIGHPDTKTVRLILLTGIDINIIMIPLDTVVRHRLHRKRIGVVNLSSV